MKHRNFKTGLCIYVGAGSDRDWRWLAI